MMPFQPHLWVPRPADAERQSKSTNNPINRAVKLTILFCAAGSRAGGCSGTMGA